MIEPTTSLPELIILTDEADYDGGAEIVGIRDEQWAFTDSVASLELTERTGASVPVRYRHGWLDTILEVGRSYRATLRNGGVENLTYTFLELRDTTDRLLLAYHTGSDQLYQAGAFDTPELAGFTLALTPICRSSVEDGCFEDQTQSLYQGTFAADDRLSLDYLRQDGLLTVLGLSYGVTFWCDSVDGGRSLCGGAGYPGRYLDFQVTAR